MNKSKVIIPLVATTILGLVAANLTIYQKNSPSSSMLRAKPNGRWEMNFGLAKPKGFAFYFV